MDPSDVQIRASKTQDSKDPDIQLAQGIPFSASVSTRLNSCTGPRCRHRNAAGKHCQIILPYRRSYYITASDANGDSICLRTYTGQDKAGLRSHQSLLCRHGELQCLYCLLAALNVRCRTFSSLEAEVLDPHLADQAASHHVAPWWTTPS